jgi:hypothetical protein
MSRMFGEVMLIGDPVMVQQEGDFPPVITAFMITSHGVDQHHPFSPYFVACFH